MEDQLLNIYLNRKISVSFICGLMINLLIPKCQQKKASNLQANFQDDKLKHAIRLKKKKVKFSRTNSLFDGQRISTLKISWNARYLYEKLK